LYRGVGVVAVGDGGEAGFGGDAEDFCTPAQSWTQLSASIQKYISLPGAHFGRSGRAVTA